MIPNVAEVKNLQKILNQVISLRLFSNNHTPAESDTAANYTQVAGGGYAAKSLVFASWTIAGGSPSTGSYAAQDFDFTGATNAPGTIYGYYLVDADGVLMGSERFDAGVVPFTPANGSLIRVNPRYSAE